MKLKRLGKDQGVRLFEHRVDLSSGAFTVILEIDQRELVKVGRQLLKNLDLTSLGVNLDERAIGESGRQRLTGRFELNSLEVRNVDLST